MRIAILGGGIFGVTAALELRRRGHDVVVHDPGPIPHPLASSTDISKLVRADYGADAFYTDLMDEALAGWRAWNRSWGENLFHETGLTVLAGAPMRPGGFEHESFAALGARGYPLERLDAEAIAARFPAWRNGRYVDGYVNPRGGWAESGRVVARLAQAGVVVGPPVAADVTVVAAGAWTPELVPGLEGAMWATAQTVLHFRPADPDAWRPPRFLPWAADVATTGWYGFPATADGVVKVGSHAEGRRVDPGAPRVVPDGEEERFRAFLRDSLPGLADAPLAGSRVCLYGDTFDGDFWIDRHPDRPDLVVAAGGSGHAFKFAPVLGGLVADAVEGRPNPRLARFRWREPAARRRESARAGEP